MSVHSWSGTVACLLVLCLRAGCDASQQQQQPAALLGVTADEFLSLISPAVQAELQPILSRLEARVEDLDRKLEARVEDLDRKLEARVEDLDRKLEARVENVESKLAREIIGQPRDCSEMPPWATSGVYPVWPDRSQEPVQAFCQEDSESGEMWTVFQRRDDIEPHQDFYLGWKAYKRGFGNLTKEFWWGLEHLHKLTAEADRPYQLRVDLEAFDGDKVHATYNTFCVSAEEDGYRLTVSGYSGDAGDSLSYSNNTMFSTRDRDNGWSWDSCAEEHQGAWWYWNCGYSNLNGRYLNNRDGTGIWWYDWWEWESLTKTQMMLRPALPACRAGRVPGGL